jgi:hypothetical protein
VFMRPIRLSSLFPVVLLAGCGAAEFGSPGPEFVVLPSVPGVDGYTTSAAFVSTAGANAIAVGDNAGDDGRRGFVRFDLSAIPAGATVLSAVLHLYQGDIDGVPYGLGSVRVDHIDVGAALDAGDHFAAAIALDIGVLSTDNVLEWKTLDVTAAVAADVAGVSPTSDFRLRFPVGTDGDGVLDTAMFEDAEGHLATGLFPTLSVTYQE